jgi:hypothetical protein
VTWKTIIDVLIPLTCEVYAGFHILPYYCKKKGTNLNIALKSMNPMPVLGADDTLHL